MSLPVRARRNSFSVPRSTSSRLHVGLRRAVIAGTVLLLGTQPLPARAQQGSDPICQAAAEVQSLTEGQRFREARDLLLACVSSPCEETERTSCAAALQELEPRIPSLVVLATDGKGNDVVEVSLRLDGELLANSLDGMAVAVDPGEHEVSLETDSGAPVTQSIVIKEGQKYHRVEVTLSAPNSSQRSSSSGSVRLESNSAQLVGGSVLAAVGAIGVAGFVVGGLHARAEQEELEDCKVAGCPSGQVDSVRARYLVTNASLVAGVLSLGAAAWVFLSGDSGGVSDRMSNRRSRSLGGIRPGLNWDVEPNTQGGSIRLRGTF